MAVQAIKVTQMVRDSAAASTGYVIFTTCSGGMAAEYPVNDRLGFMVCWTMSSDTAEPRYMRVTIRPGDYWKTGQGSVSHLVSATSSGSFHWFFGPYDQARFGIAAASSGYVTLNENYLDVLVMVSCSSKCNSTGATYVSGERAVQVHAFALPVATFTS